MRRDLVRAGLAALVLAASLGSLTRVFTTTAWMRPAAIAGLLAIGIAAAVRRLRFGAVATAIASIIGLAVTVYVLHLPPGPLIPGSEQLQQAIELFQAGLRDFQEQPAPTDPLPGLLLIVTLVTWVIGTVTHELLVRAERPGAALVPVTVLWAVPLAVPLPPGRTWPQAVPFLLAAGLVLLLESDADVAGFRRDRELSTFSTAGALLGLGALTLAAAAPSILPGYADEAWVDLNSRDDPRGYQPIVDVGDRLRLPAPRDILQVEADRRVYLRLAGLDTFDGTTWKLGPPGVASYRPDPSELFKVGPPLPPEVELGPTEPIEVDVEVLDLENIYVPVPYQPVDLSGDATDRMVYSRVGGFVATSSLEENEIAGRPVTGVVPGLEYTVQAALPAAGAELLSTINPDPNTVAPHLALPSRYERMASLAREVYAQAGAQSNLDRALALQDFFAGADSEFTYSTSVDVLRGDGALETFLFDTKVGYCEYYATAMAVMLRATGVPARVAVGFVGGRLTQRADPAVGRDRNTYTISTEDAHAWVEVLFPGAGWVTFEPTPRSDGRVQVPTRGDLTPELSEAEEQASEALPDPTEEAPDTPPIPSEQPTELPGGLEPDAGTDSGSSFGDNGSGALPLLALLLLTGTGIALLTASWYRRPTHPTLPAPERVRYASRRVQHAATGYGVGRRPHETTREVVQRWISEGRVEPSAAERFRMLSDAAAFGGQIGPEDGAEAEDLATHLVGNLRDSVSPRDRVLAPLREPMQRANEQAKILRERMRDS